MSSLRVAVLGSTGSIGINALRTVRALGGRVCVELLAARGTKADLLAEQAAACGAPVIVAADPAKADAVRAKAPEGCRVCGGMDALCEELASDRIDLVLCAIAGSAGLRPAVAALQAGKRLALATKEVMVMAGRMVTDLARKKNVTILPVDSEHSAVFQCLEGRDPASVRSLILTASGGPFRTWTRAQIERVSPEQALRHPTWSMGKGITIDSASLMNKALEVVEARWLFGMEEDRIEVLIHPQSVVHSMIRLKDGAVLAQLGVPDMRLPIQLAFTWPERIRTDLPELDLAQTGKLEFSEIDSAVFPSIGFAREALRLGGTYPAVMNAANETARARFLSGEIGFTGIWHVVEKTLEAHEPLDDGDLAQILEADRRAREYACEVRV